MSPVQITSDLLLTMPVPQPNGGSKDERGRVLVIAGSVEVPGAALLAGTAALRAGAGKLQIATCRTAATLMGLAVPEALVIGLPETPRGGFAVGCAERLCAAAKKVDAVLIGPGMTEEESTAHLTEILLSQAPSPAFVIDAAALGDLASAPDVVRSGQGRVVITPHAGEMARLMDLTRDEVEADPLETALAAARLLQVVVVMKGERTFIVDPVGKSWEYAGGGIGLATSGSGDVLAGVITGLLARGATIEQAACWGVFLHGEAGTRLANAQGPLGFLARELSAEIPRILRDTV